MGDLERILGVLQEARRRLVRIALVLGPLFGALLLFRLQPTSLPLLGRSVPFAYPYPWPSPFNNVTAQLFRVLVGYWLPPGVQVINVSVGDAVMVQLEIGLLLTLILGMPWIVHEVGAFLVPALRKNERQLIRQIGIPATALFAVGTALGIVWLTPLTYRLLFLYVAAMGLLPTIGAVQFATFGLLYSLAFGVVFELPVFIYALSRLGVVPAAAWRKHWRAAVLGSLFFGMIVTPDNSGITMLLIAIPMIGLYLGGAYFAGRWERHRTPRPILATGA